MAPAFRVGYQLDPELAGLLQYVQSAGERFAARGLSNDPRVQAWLNELNAGGRSLLAGDVTAGVITVTASDELHRLVAKLRAIEEAFRGR